MSFSFLPRRQGLLLRAPWLLAVVAAACGDQTDEARDFISPTRLVVDPADFLGSVPCGSGQGAMRQYQATLVDVTDGLDRTFVLPSARLVGCDRTVTFDFVEPGRSYIARITGFDRSDL